MQSLVIFLTTVTTYINNFISETSKDFINLYSDLFELIQSYFESVPKFYERQEFLDPKNSNPLLEYFSIELNKYSTLYGT